MIKFYNLSGIVVGTQNEREQIYFRRGIIINQVNLTKEIQRLIDIEEIKQLKYRYAEICDDGHNPDRICSVFTEDGYWDGGDRYGQYRGHKEIHDAWVSFSKSIEFSRHNMMNPIITVDGNIATGEWYCVGLYRARNGKDCMQAVTYYETYERINGKWLMKTVRPVMALIATREEGWEKVLLTDWVE